MRRAIRESWTPDELLEQRRQCKRRLDELDSRCLRQPLREALPNQRYHGGTLHEEGRHGEAYGRRDDLAIIAQLRQMVLDERPVAWARDAEREMRKRQKLIER